METKRILFTSDAKFSVTPSTNGGPGVLAGYALVWNQKSSDRGGFKVSLAPDSAKFADTTFALWNHNYDSPLGRTDNNTLSLSSDNYGVKFSLELPNTQLGRDTAENVRTGLVRGMSFGMLMDGAEFTTAKDGDGDEVDTFTSFNADEVTITPIPAFINTAVAVAGASPTRHSRSATTIKLEDTKEIPHVEKDFTAEILKHEEYRLRLYGLAEFQTA